MKIQKNWKKNKVKSTQKIHNIYDKWSEVVEQSIKKATNRVSQDKIEEGQMVNRKVKECKKAIVSIK